MVQTVVVFIVVGLAAAYIARIYIKRLRQGKSGICNCGCTACGQSGDYPQSSCAKEIIIRRANVSDTDTSRRGGNEHG